MIGLDQGGRSRPVLTTWAPGGVCHNFVERLWAENEGGQFSGRPWRVVPEATSQLIAVRRSSGMVECWLVGARSSYVDIDRMGRVLTCGIQLRPGALRPLLEIAADELTDRGVRIEQIGGRAGARLHDRLQDATDASGILEHLQSYLGDLAARAGAIDWRVRAFEDSARQRPDRSVAAIARELRVSTRTLSWCLKREVGLGPKLLLRIGRAHRVAQAAVTRAEAYTSLAHRLGYHDHAHMLHDFDRLMGEGPRQFAARGSR